YRKAAQAFVADVLAMGTPTPRHQPGSSPLPDPPRHPDTARAKGGTTPRAHRRKTPGEGAEATPPANPWYSPRSRHRCRRSGRPARTPSGVGGATAAGSPPAPHHPPSHRHAPCTTHAPPPPTTPPPTPPPARPPPARPA